MMGGEGVSGFGIGVGELTLSSLDVLQGFSFFLQMGFTLILATLDGLDVGLLGDVIGEDDCDDDGCPGFLKPLVLAVFVLRSQELHNPQLHLGIPIS
ncbi:hypothetical protein Tco_0464634 [Tanacetum coccineum]